MTGVEQPPTSGQRPSVRLFDASDAPACCDVVNAAIVEMDGINEAARPHIVERNTPDLLGADLAAWTSYVVEIDALGLVGVGALDGAEIKRVYVYPAAQGLGVGRTLLQVLEDEANAQGSLRSTLMPRRRRSPSTPRSDIGLTPLAGSPSAKPSSALSR